VEAPGSRTFPGSETAERLRALLDEGPVRVDTESGAFVGGSPEAPMRLEPPLLRRIRPGVGDANAWLEDEARGPRLQALVLLQAGAFALGLWRGEELLAHKCTKKYVVRGKGRAQPTHLRTKGKSRYGSRLRLRNFEALLVETNEKLREFGKTHGPFDDVFKSVPVRIWPELFEVDPPPPFAKDDPRLVRIPIHVHLPGFEELLRVHRALSRGRILPA
jgi:hypothetical protein